MQSRAMLRNMKMLRLRGFAYFLVINLRMGQKRVHRKTDFVQESNGPALDATRRWGVDSPLNLGGRPRQISRCARQSLAV